jgi:histidinol-phosphate aminotransferase
MTSNNAGFRDSLSAYCPLVAEDAALRLDKNEGRLPPGFADAVADALSEDLSRYPDMDGLRNLLAERHAVDARQVLVTAGGDDALLRICLSHLRGGGEMILATPTFEMLARYATMAGGTVVNVPWDWTVDAPFPMEAMLACINARTRLIAVVSPNNPTGMVVTAADLQRLSEQAPDATLIVDLAYDEFANQNLHALATRLPNTVVVRTFSKAWGMAGLRVGYALAAPSLIERLAAHGNPYAVSRLSAGIVSRVLKSASDIGPYVEAVRSERTRLTQWLRSHGARVCSSEANFVLASFSQTSQVWQRLADNGISVRKFPADSPLAEWLRITLPGNAGDYAELVRGLEAALKD